MPVRSLHSSVLAWPDADTVRRAVAAWAAEAGRRRPDVRRIGYFGSYARGDWGVGSDVDIVVVLSDSTVPFERRGVEWDTGGLPVPGDVLVYTEQECLALRGRGRFSDVLAREVIWVLERQSQKISRMQDRPGESPVDPAAVETDPVIEAYKKDIDRTLLRANLARTVDERLQNLCRLQRFAEELKRARRTVG